jgi:hypothetical protein
MTGLVPAIHAAQRNERLKKASINPRRALRLPPLPPLAPMWRASLQPRDVDGPDTPGHDGYGSANNRTVDQR